MNLINHLDYPTMSGVANYRVRGHLDGGLSGKLKGMNVDNLVGSNGKVESVLEGSLLDQAALAGVLNQLYELHLPVISVDCLGAPVTSV